nr:hypothetical protein [Armatimonadota bacterium]
VHVTLTGNLGKAATGHFDLSIKLPGENKPLVFHNLPCNPLFHTLTWIGYTMNANQHAVMYLDNLELRPAG